MFAFLHSDNGGELTGSIMISLMADDHKCRADPLPEWHQRAWVRGGAPDDGRSS